MRDRFILLILGANFYTFLQSIEGFLRVGTAAFAFVASGLSVFLLIQKERHNIKKIFGRVGEDKKPPSEI